ncbi:MAG TPA: cell division protein FtsL [Gammaproteobacteria bacterium]|nr:cell division protein FtsL [Gammaproteobacteria bacterium]
MMPWIKVFVTEQLAIILMIMLCMSSALAVIYIKHHSRATFVALQKLEADRDQLNENWEKFLIEHSTWSRPDYIEQRARQELGMVIPATRDIQVLQ